MYLKPILRRLYRSVAGHRGALVCAVVLTAFLARGTPLNLLPGPHGAAAHFLANQNHRPCFDHNDSQWLGCPSVPPSVPLLTVSSCPVFYSSPYLESVVDGWHRDRSPPLSSRS